MSERKSPVQALAEARSILVRTPRSLKSSEEQQAFAALEADAAVVVAYGLILPKAVIETPRWGCYNLHASRLPRWRGAAPIQRAIMAGDETTAATIMRMDEGLDTGPVCLTEDIPIGPDMTAGELHDLLAERGAHLMSEALRGLELGSLSATPQSTSGVTYASKIDKAEARIDFRRSARDVHNLIRGLSPFPGAWFEAAAAAGPERMRALRSTLTSGHGRPGEILDDALAIACGEGAVRILEAQRAGKRAMGTDELLRGLALPRGTILPGATEFPDRR
jgi:methionyl-tRNA formyltransferase